VHFPFRSSSSSSSSSKWCEACYRTNLALCTLDGYTFTHKCESAEDLSVKIANEIEMFQIDSDSSSFAANVESLSKALRSYQYHLDGHCAGCKFKVISSESRMLFVHIYMRTVLSKELRRRL
jgi:hypothetical protein